MNFLSESEIVPFEIAEFKSVTRLCSRPGTVIPAENDFEILSIYLKIQCDTIYYFYKINLILRLKMDFKRLICFVKLAENLHFGKTAAELGMAQSALSRQILLLEKELGCRLLDRSNRWDVSLTPAGEAYLPEGRKILEQVEHAGKVAIETACGESGHLSIDVVSSVMNFRAFLHSLQEMRTHHPKLHLNIQEGVSNRIYERVRNQEADVGIVRIPATPDEELDMLLLARNYLLMAIPEKHPLAKKKRLYLHDFARERFIVPRARDVTLPGSQLEIICLNAGFTPEIALEIENMTTILHLLPALNCVTLVPDSFAGKFEGLVFRSLEDYSQTLPLSAVWRRDNRSQALRNFLNIQKKAIRETENERAGLYGCR